MAASSGHKHDWSRKNKTNDDDEDDEEDPVESMIKKTGCLELHYKVQECMADHRDWRKCQKEVTEFKKCVTSHHQQQGKEK